MELPPSILVDRRNYDELLPQLVAGVLTADLIGLDCETHDTDRHEGIMRFCGYKEAEGKKAGNKKLVFDMRRTTLCGLSLYWADAPAMYYFNIAHADVENRLTWPEVKAILDARREGVNFVCHNASFELTVFANTVGYDLEPVICTNQMAVSAYNPDQYDKNRFVQAGQGGIAKLMGQIRKLSPGFAETRTMSPALEEVVNKIIAKASDAEHSYNGFIHEISYGYGLKSAVRSFFGYEMTTFDEVLGGHAHMGQLTGEEVAAYGADDAFWCLALFHFLLDWMAQNCPAAIDTFFSQENVMVPIYSSIWQQGWRVNEDEILQMRKDERATMAQTLRDLKRAVRALLPFEEDPKPSLMKRETKWYTPNWKKYRTAIIDWAASDDEADDYEQCMQVRGPVSKAWSAEFGKPESTGPNFSHYMPVRTLLYDLCGLDLLVVQGSVQSDGEARGKLLGKATGAAVDVINCLNQIAGIEQRMKLYIAPYQDLMDPETERMYPVVSSELATRRMASAVPNVMQLSKRTEMGQKVRGFFKADNDEHVLISHDWSSIELVDIGEKSQDPEFIKAYGQLPHADLHAGAAADILTVEVPELTEEIFKSLKFATEWPDLQNVQRLQTNLKGEPLPMNQAYGYWRTEVGKGANFNYWYSGFLATIGERMGWPMSTTSLATEKYRNRFSVAEQWRVDTIENVRKYGYVDLPDGQRRMRFEATDEWYQLFVNKFLLDERHFPDFNAVIRWIATKIRKRANNQSVNAMIQGSCATIAKRSAKRIVDEIKKRGMDARFVIPIHDELVSSVHKSCAVEYIRMANEIMTDHPDLFKICKLDTSASIGLTFQPFKVGKCEIGQVELAELPKIGIGVAGKAANDDQIQDIISYLFDRRKVA